MLCPFHAQPQNWNLAQPQRSTRDRTERRAEQQRDWEANKLEREEHRRHNARAFCIPTLRLVGERAAQ